MKLFVFVMIITSAWSVYPPALTITDLVDTYNGWVFTSDSSEVTTSQCGETTYLGPFSTGTITKSFSTGSEKYSNLQVVIDAVLLGRWKQNTLYVSVNNQTWNSSSTVTNFVYDSTCSSTLQLSSFVYNWTLNYTNSLTDVNLQLKTDLNTIPSFAGVLLRNIRLYFWNSCSSDSYSDPVKNECSQSCSSGYYPDVSRRECKYMNVSRVFDLVASFSGWQFSDSTAVPSSQCGSVKLLGGYNQLSGGAIVKKVYDLNQTYDLLRVQFDLYVIDSWSFGNALFVRINGGFWTEIFTYNQSSVGTSNLCGAPINDKFISNVTLNTSLQTRNNTQLIVEFVTDLDQTADIQSFGISNLRIMGWNANNCSKFLFPNGTCVSSCPDGYFANPVAKFCELCLGGCLLCPLGPDICACAAGYYLDSATRNCTVCNSTCLTCAGAGPNNCTSCATGLFLLSLNSSCVQTCPEGYRANTDTGTCEECAIANCSSCDASADVCTACMAGFFQPEGSTDCVACNTYCASCEGVPSNCTSCSQNYYLYDKTCLVDCDPIGFYKDTTNMRCEPCDDPLCSNCSTSVASCSTCIPEFFVNADLNVLTCTKCHWTCYTCNGPNSDNCLSCNGFMYLLDNECLPSCPDGTYKDSTTNQCESCSDRCLTCTGPSFTQCDKCNETAGFLSNGASGCYPQVCGDGVVVGTEQCDTGEKNSIGGCNSTCHIQVGWSCTQTNRSQPSICTTICGDSLKIGSLLGGTEECDDGNVIDGDGCSSACKIEGGYTCNDTYLSRPFSNIPYSKCSCEPTNLTGQLFTDTLQIEIDFVHPIIIAEDDTNGSISKSACNLFLQQSEANDDLLGSSRECSIQTQKLLIYLGNGAEIQGNQTLELLSNAIKYQGCPVALSSNLNLMIITNESGMVMVGDTAYTIRTSHGEIYNYCALSY